MPILYIIHAILYYTIYTMPTQCWLWRHDAYYTCRPGSGSVHTAVHQPYTYTAHRLEY